uniref:Uncharacterized protein n=1 Tax=Megaselia scalaris TaxID=36166 RepID=T1H5Z2_MEGSC
GTELVTIPETMGHNRLLEPFWADVDAPKFALSHDLWHSCEYLVGTHILHCSNMLHIHQEQR